ncbi:MAG: hypothetical protein O3A00_25290 [Planctomycetota bacterium]|nr:hypothetical protein [Planctomycetota bacterium]
MKMTLDSKELLKQYEPKPLKVVSTKGQLFGSRFTQCGKYLISGGFDGLIHRWDASTDDFKPLPAIGTPGGWTQALAVDSKLQRLFCGDSWGKLCCWSYADQQPQPRWTIDAAHDGWLRAVAVSSDGKLIATCGLDQRVRVWSADSGERLHEFVGHGEDVFTVAFHSDNNSLVTGDLKGIVKHWDVSTGKHVRDLDAGVLFAEHRLQDVGGVRVMTFSPNESQLVVAGTQPKNGGNVQGVPTILCFDWKSGKLATTLEVGQVGDVYVSDLQFHPGGFMIITTSGNPGTGKLHYQRVTDKTPFFTSSKMPNCKAVSLHPAGFRVAVTATNGGSNGNGRRLTKDGEYAGNTSPIHILDMPKPDVAAAKN